MMDDLAERIALSTAGYQNERLAARDIQTIRAAGITKIEVSSVQPLHAA